MIYGEDAIVVIFQAALGIALLGGVILGLWLMCPVCGT